VIRAVLFDAGATLLHADPPVEEVYIRAFEKDGAPGGRAGILRALQTTWREVKEKKLADRYGGASGERDFWQAFVARSREHLDGGSVSQDCFSSLVEHFVRPQSWAVYPDVVPALEQLAEKGLALGVVSNWDSSLRGLLEAHGLAPRFSAILISALEQTGKPEAEIFLRACERLGVSPAEALHAGDSPEEDFEAARRAGLTAVLLDREGRHSGLEPRVASLLEIPPRLSDFAP
jgi:putative hydrolase of the HAD superfamily